jgi:YD repeat-containing protein
MVQKRLSVVAGIRGPSCGIQAGALLTLDIGYGTSNNNGNVRDQTITPGGGLTLAQTYMYDAVNRLDLVSENGQWSRDYGYDAFGNRAVTGVQVGPGTPQSLAAFDAVKAG